MKIYKTHKTFINTKKLETMSMTFIFNEEKIKKYNENHVHPIERLRKYFKKYGIKEYPVGTFTGKDSDFAHFASCVYHLPDHPWFMDYIDKWYWDTSDGREDVLDGISRAEKINKNYG